MTSPKVKKGGKAGKAGGAFALVSIALDFLNSPPVREFLKKAPTQVKEWAQHRRAELHVEEKKRTKVTDRFGQKGLESRLAALRGTVNVALSAPDAPGRAEVDLALDSLHTALQVAGPLPLLKRKRAHFAIDNALDRIERQFIDAVIGQL